MYNYEEIRKDSLLPRGQLSVKFTYNHKLEKAWRWTQSRKISCWATRSLIDSLHPVLRRLSEETEASFRIEQRGIFLVLKTWWEQSVLQMLNDLGKWVHEEDQCMGEHSLCEALEQPPFFCLATQKDRPLKRQWKFHFKQILGNKFWSYVLRGSGFQI